MDIIYLHRLLLLFQKVHDHRRERWLSNPLPLSPSDLLLSGLLLCLGLHTASWPLSGDLADGALERKPLERLTEKRELAVFRHEGFWQCMDDQKQMEMLNTMWDTGDRPWAAWESGDE